MAAGRVVWVPRDSEALKLSKPLFLGQGEAMFSCDNSTSVKEENVDFFFLM